MHANFVSQGHQLFLFVSSLILKWDGDHNGFVTAVFLWCTGPFVYFRYEQLNNSHIGKCFPVDDSGQALYSTGLVAVVNVAVIMQIKPSIGWLSVDACAKFCVILRNVHS